VDDAAFFERAILASAATIDDADAVRQLRQLFGTEEMSAWESVKSSAFQVPVPVGHDDLHDFYWAKWGEFGLEGTSPHSYEGAITDLSTRVRAWAGLLGESSPRIGEPTDVLTLAGLLSALTDDELFVNLLVRASFDQGELAFRIAEFPRPDLRPRNANSRRWAGDREDPDSALRDRIAMTPHPIRRGTLPRPPGLHRVAGGRWVDDDGAPVTEPEVLERLRRLAIPPAWVEVWASADPTSRVQATGVDSRNRTQYRYSEAAVAEAAENKFAHMIDFAHHLPRLRAAVAADLGDVDRDSATTVAATVVRLLDRGLFRVGNAEYARDNHTHGLTTLVRSNVAVAGETLTFDFVGKEHLNLHLQLADPVSAKFVRQLLEVERPPDSLLFVTEDDGALRHIDSATVNAYIHTLVGVSATAKTFRTWGATAVAAAVAGGAEFPVATTGRRKPDSIAYEAAAHMLGNTPTVARQSYVHPNAISSGRSAAVRAAVERAAKRNDTRDVRILFHDEELQKAIWRALAGGVG
jgi:DNA topoisomerase-1